MYELIQVTEKAYYMDCPAKVGFYNAGNNNIFAIDAGSDKDAGKKVKKLLDGQGWQLKAIFNTHSHADHIGGNQYLQNQTGCRIYANAMEQAAAQYPMWEPHSLYGGFPTESMRSKFLMAAPSDVCPLAEDDLPAGLMAIPLPGHSYDMVGFRTEDGAVFLADALASAETLEKYKLVFLYDVKAYLETLAQIENMQGACFVPSHAAPTENIAPLARLNIQKTSEAAEAMENLLAEPKTFENLLQDVFTKYDLSMNLSQRMLVGSTVKSYLSYLKNESRIDYFFENNCMLWKKV